VKIGFSLFTISLIIFISAIQFESNLLGSLSILVFALGIVAIAYAAWRIFLTISPMNLNSFDVTSLSNLNVEIITLHLDLNIEINNLYFQKNIHNIQFDEAPSCSFCF
jgi:hypothetical protein